ncbi:MAG: HEAT repeat domain-containing protein, partial [Anaerolineae bacterium]|nr:HEAT repeat domain-containing protein [Anaerolineae bacterium]
WRFKEMDQFPEVLLDLRADLTHPDPRPRRASIEALAALGDGDSVPALVALLEDGDTSVSEAAYNALVLLTKQDFALNAGKWSTWWEANRTRPRVLWLIDGLVHGTPQIRTSAARDLEELTGLSFGYRFDLPAPEREAARRRFLEWWADAGRFRFGRG